MGCSGTQWDAVGRRGVPGVAFKHALAGGGGRVSRGRAPHPQRFVCGAGDQTACGAAGGTPSDPSGNRAIGQVEQLSCGAGAMRTTGRGAACAIAVRIGTAGIAGTAGSACYAHAARGSAGDGADPGLDRPRFARLPAVKQSIRSARGRRSRAYAWAGQKRLVEKGSVGVRPSPEKQPLTQPSSDGHTLMSAGLKVLLSSE